MRLPLHVLGPYLVTLGLIVWLFTVASADAKVKLTLESSHYQFEPAYARIKVTVEPDPGNRGLTVAAISDGFETSSYEKLDGAAARRTRWVEFKSIPEGQYDLIAQVGRADRHVWRAQTTMTVLSPQ